MKAMLLMTLFSLGLIGTSYSYGGWEELSIWQKSRMQSNTIVGQIKAIAIDDESDQIVLKVQKAGKGSRSEFLRFCSEGYMDVQDQFLASEQMELIRQAMARGQMVRLSYRSMFDRCLSAVAFPSTNFSNEAL